MMLYVPFSLLSVSLLMVGCYGYFPGILPYNFERAGCVCEN